MSKNWSCIVVTPIALLAWGGSAQSASGQGCPCDADVNGDGQVTPADLICFRQCRALGPEVCGGSFDKCDVDCDGRLTDCDRFAIPCRADGGTPAECCPTPPPEVCDDLIDNDCDGFADCLDPDCSVTSPPPEDEFSPIACVDGFDNDCDGDTDCADTDCQNSSEHEFGGLACGDGLDNDCDGDVDCDDADCQCDADVDGDGQVTPTDVICFRQCFVAGPEACGGSFDKCDVDCDGLLTPN